MLVIRKATEGDVPAITEIYNYAVLNTVATFDLEPKSIEDRRKWFHEHDKALPILVAVEGEIVVGWSAMSEWSEKKAYRISAEISLYVKPGREGEGIGKALTDALLAAGSESGIRTIIARIVGGNEVSSHILETRGFRYIGVMLEVGKKFGRLLDVHLYQKTL